MPTDGTITKVPKGLGGLSVLRRLRGQQKMWTENLGWRHWLPSKAALGSSRGKVYVAGSLLNMREADGKRGLLLAGILENILESILESVSSGKKRRRVLGYRETVVKRWNRPLTKGGLLDWVAWLIVSQKL